MQIVVVTGEGRQLEEPFLVRLGGWTEDRYFCEAPEDRIWEFHDGELIVHSPARPGHQRVVGFLTFILTGYVRMAVARGAPIWSRLPAGDPCR